MISGYVEKILYKNDENAYCILEVSSEEGENVLVGTFPFIEEGNFIEAEGSLKIHPVYGPQIAVTSYRVKDPGDVISIQKYLSSGAIKGIGETLAGRIIKKFGEDTLRVMEEEPERLVEIKGISERMAIEISSQIEEKRDLKDAMIFLAGYGVSMKLAVKIYSIYGKLVYSVIQENPYKLSEDIPGVGFLIADEIAKKVGLRLSSEYRIKAGIMYVLSKAGAEGHMYLPEDVLIDESIKLLGADEVNIRELISELQMEKRIIRRNTGVYTDTAYYTELNTAIMLMEINKANPIEIITGGPGTGKTTNIKQLIAEYEEAGRKVALAAPTGRAAKRMTQATGHEATTIHRLLEVNGAPSEEEDSDDMPRFERNESNPLDAEVIIIDEMSMVDIYIMNALLKAVTPGSKLVLVGDINQLPSVGPGNVLRDIIDSGLFNVKKLTKIYRQAAESDIVMNAHKMINEEKIDLDKRSQDFLIVKRKDPDPIISAMITLVTEKLPAYVKADPMEIQIMSPMKKGALGVERLNVIFREYLNPKTPSKEEKDIGGRLWRENDKVMQVKNNYDLGVYNGDIGIIREINSYEETVYIDFDGRIVEYDFADTDELELAYAITVHKAQGSEYPAVVLPLYQGPEMLMTRNLIYTAVTRAQKCVTLVGERECFYKMTSNTREMKRFTGLKDLLVERNEEAFEFI